VSDTVKLLEVGRRLAVLGCEVPTPTRPTTFRWWHVVQPGSYSIPQVGDTLTYGKSVCGKVVATNGYAADYRPPEGELCPKCSERL